MIAFVSQFQAANPFVDLLANVFLTGKTAAGAETPVITKDTSTQGNGTVDIGASKTCIHADTLYPMSKSLLQEVVIAKIAMSFGSPVKVMAGGNGVFC